MKKLHKIQKMSKETLKFLCLFIVVFLVFFVGLNFKSFSSRVSYELSGGKSLISSAEAITQDQNGEKIKDANQQTNFLENSADSKFQEQISNSILIPKINVNTPIVFPSSSKEKDVLLALKSGVAFYPDSALPGDQGSTIILGHSSSPLFGKGSYDTVFSFLDKLEKGDKIILNYNQKEYIYEVENQYIFSPKDKVLSQNVNQSSLILLSCWPGGTSQKRIAIEAKLIS